MGRLRVLFACSGALGVLLGAAQAGASDLLPAGVPDLEACRYERVPSGVEIPPELHEEFEALENRISAAHTRIAAAQSSIHEMTDQIESIPNPDDSLTFLRVRDELFIGLDREERRLEGLLDRRSRLIRIATEISVRTLAGPCVPTELIFGDTCLFTRRPLRVRARGALGAEIEESLGDVTEHYDRARAAEREASDNCPQCRMTGQGVDEREADRLQIEGYEQLFRNRTVARSSRLAFEDRRRHFSGLVTLAVRLQVESRIQESGCVSSSEVRVRETPVLGGIFRIYEYVPPTSAEPSGVDANEGR